ncbi:MAG: bifunctional (p)ppGpp synthetase/guanosine-3',5'-bis(diphosphate) 3'-pyrophosphohydrolase [Clostridiales bacterium]|nr:bifunctional (p)ppGpp synthetase/guanosine-3',5'-bis(diphosphate) 3'-pyrophosphohydrolase [Clostridiales bacterium]
MDDSRMDSLNSFKDEAGDIFTPDEEYMFLANTELVPEIPEDIEEKYEEVIKTYIQFLSKNSPGNEVNDSDLAFLRKAFLFAYKAHRNQRRKTGEMYIIHPIAVAQILAEFDVDAETLAGAFLHDTIEDTPADIALLSELFSPTVANLVDGVTKINTKLGMVRYDSKVEQQADNIRKMLMAMTDDIRVIFIKLADRLHNMRTLRYQTPEKQVEKAQETMDIYVPFAGRFGIYRIKWELEDLCFRFLHPNDYYELAGMIAGTRADREDFMSEVVSQLQAKLSEYGIKNADIEGRPKHLYSIYKKMHDKGKTIDQIYDIFACRIIVEEITDCYTVLGIVHEMYQHVPGRFKDYIAMPKENKYQSIHTTVIAPGGITFEVQIRTYAMHKIAEYGIAAHWHYKEAGNSREFKADKYDSKINEVRQMLDSQGELSDPTQVLDFLRMDLSPDEIFIYTPKGSVIKLPVGSTPIDFAYAIHSDIGNHMHGAKVNGRIVPLSYELHNGDLVEVFHSQKVSGPSRDWVNVARTASARAKINAWFKKEARPENIIAGKEKLEREIERNGFDPNKLLMHKSIESILKRNSYQSLDDMYASIGYGGISVIKVFGKLRDDYIRSIPEAERTKLGYRVTSDGQVAYRPKEMPVEIGKIDQNKPGKKNPKAAVESVDVDLKSLTDSTDIVSAAKHINRIKRRTQGRSEVLVENLDGVATHYSKCCHPVYGDEIIGYITQNGGVGIHKATCSNILNIIKYKDRSEKDKERFRRLVAVQWLERAQNSVFDVTLQIVANDRDNLLFDCLDNIREEKASVVKVNTLTSEDFIAYMNITLTITNKMQLDRIIGRIKSVRDVITVKRK